MHNTSKGRIGELIAVSKFLEKGFEVFQTAVDISGVDFIAVPISRRFKDKSLKIQVKSIPSIKKTFRISKNPSPADFYFFVVTDTEDFWLIPFTKVKKIIKSIKARPRIKDAMFRLIPERWEKFYGFNTISNILKAQKFPFHASRTGKIGEKIGASYLIKNDIEVYESLCDIKGVDLVIKVGDRHYDLQIKYSSNSYTFRNVRQSPPRSNYLFLFIKKDSREFFIIPSKIVWRNSNKSGGIYIHDALRKKYKGLNLFK
jgi:hypothetical protein